MEELLRQFMGKMLDVNCGTGAMFRGEVRDVRDGVLYILDEEEKLWYVTIGSIVGFTETNEHSSRPGFIGK
ncbi:MAG: MM0924 family protein [Blastocatellia bacterium]